MPSACPCGRRRVRWRARPPWSGWSRLARDLGPRGITINNVQQPIDTDLNPADSDFGAMLRTLMALPRYGAAEEIAALVAYLAGPEAGFVTGASLTIDGGFTA
jgi:3-oxoacyl-[acyl-carrier protein] reductase